MVTEQERMAELLLPEIDKTPEYYEALYPERQLPEGARVTRIAPSPTGYLHLGTLFMSLVNRMIADSTGGVFFTRIEDTDKKREIEGGIEDIIDGLHRFGIKIDEGFISGTEQTGNYGPYQQSKRAEIYQTYVKDLIRQGLAYPCFMTAEELDDIRALQEKDKLRPGCYGKWAKYRDITPDEAKALIDGGHEFVVRLRSPGSEDRRITFEDGVKGKIEMPENDEDFVLLKSDGIPTYHFAHAIDDHLMHTTHVIRGDEWLSSVPKHIQLFRLLGFKVPKYVHVSPILKLDDGKKRKISKRKDPEAAVKYFAEQGYEPRGVLEYLMTIAASDFEDWRRANPAAPLNAYKLNFKKMSVSGALFDGDKLNDVAKTAVSRMTAEEVTEKLIAWAKEFDGGFYELINRDREFTRQIFSIDRGTAKPRKDIAKWSDAKNYCAYFFDELFDRDRTLPEGIPPASAADYIEKYREVYRPETDNSAWFETVKSACPAVGFADDTKEYKKHPELYKGNPGDASTIIRIAVTGRRMTPELCSIMRIIGYDKCIERMKSAEEFWRHQEEK